MERNAIVVGAGIGGLAAGVALRRQGWSVRVLERASALERVGAGIGVAPNALRVLDQLGAGAQVRALAALQGDGGIRRYDGRWLARTSAEAVASRCGAPLVIARRADLVRILRDLLPADTLSLGSEVVEVRPGDDTRPACVTTKDETLRAALVVSADGIHSRTRRALFPATPAPRYTGCTSWRFIAPEPVGYRPAETWGPGRAFGLMPLSGGEVYCYAMAYARAGERVDDEAAYLRELFAGWHEPIGALLAAASDVEVLRNDVYDLPTPLAAANLGRVALLGDAAHAMAPNMGQGGCQAIEDSVVLAHQVGSGRVPVTDALAAYTAARRPRTSRIVRQSRQMMRIAQLSAPPAVLARNAGMAAARLLSADVTSRLFLDVAGWRPPEEEAVVAA